MAVNTLQCVTRISNVQLFCIPQLSSAYVEITCECLFVCVAHCAVDAFHYCGGHQANYHCCIMALQQAIITMVQVHL